MFQVDAFTDTVFSGNPAAVVPLDAWLAPDLMQSIANENNLAETAFFVPAGGQPDCWDIRWFTPTTEVPLCGHATLASAAVMDRLGHDSWPIAFRSASGPLQVDREDGVFELDFPANEPRPAEAPAGLADALGTAIGECFLARDLYLVPLADEEAVAALAPDFSLIRRIVSHGVIVTAPGERVDFVSRFFAPGIGINEDPVTGAAHCVLTPYWSKRLRKERHSGRQISARGGRIDCEYRGDRVALRGRAVIYLDGEITVPDRP